MIKQKDLKFKNNLFYYKDKLFTGQSIDNNRDKWWYKEGKRHRDNDLPAIEYSNGTKLWYKEGKIHRDNGPAMEYSDGEKYWYKEGKLHRDNGPALEYSNGDKEWFYNGKKIICKNNEEYLRIIKLLIFK